MMKKIALLIIFSLFIGGVGVFGQEKGKKEKKETLVKIGDKVPSFEVTMFDGKKLKIDDLKGKVVLLNFWATWCPPCQMELKRVQKELIERFKGKDFVFLPISREDSYEQIKKFREKNGYTFPMGMDPERKIYSKFATTTIPRNFIIDKKGNIVYMEIGYDEKSFRALIAKLEELLKK